MAAISVTLPVGVTAGDGWRRDAAIRPLCGNDEAFLGEFRESVVPAAWVTEVLTRCLQSLAGHAPVAADRVRDLTVGDREALLLHLRIATFGSRLTCVIQCPTRTCGHLMTLELQAEQILCSPSPDAAPEHVTSLEAEDRRLQVRFRLPTGRDQEAVARLAREDIGAAVEAILRGCVLAVEDESGQHVLEGDILATVRAELPAVMAGLDPQAEMILTATCPDCGTAVASEFEAADFLVCELAGGADRLYRDVHVIASHYHWTEQQILALPCTKRRRYLELIADEPARAAS